jgi:hypothetical protein
MGSDASDGWTRLPPAADAPTGHFDVVAEQYLDVPSGPQSRWFFCYAQPGLRVEIPPGEYRVFLRGDGEQGGVAVRAEFRVFPDPETGRLTMRSDASDENVVGAVRPAAVNL